MRSQSGGNDAMTHEIRQSSCNQVCLGPCGYIDSMPSLTPNQVRNRRAQLEVIVLLHRVHPLFLLLETFSPLLCGFPFRLPRKHANKSRHCLMSLGTSENFTLGKLFSNLSGVSISHRLDRLVVHVQAECNSFMELSL